MVQIHSVLLLRHERAGRPTDVEDLWLVEERWLPPVQGRWLGLTPHSSGLPHPPYHLDADIDANIVHYQLCLPDWFIVISYHHLSWAIYWTLSLLQET